MIIATRDKNTRPNLLALGRDKRGQFYYMIIRKAYKFRLKTNLEVEKLMFQFAGCNRKVWNMALALQKDTLDKIKKMLSYNYLAGKLVDWKRTNDFLQKLSTAMSKNHAVIVAEDLGIKNMSASAKGDIEQPGKNVKAKAGLNKSILDQGWGNFLRMLGYKQAWSGGKLIQVDPKNTSRTCPACGHVSVDNRKTQALFFCNECGYTANADYVASVNIKARGIEQLKAAGHCRDSLWRENVSSPTKQEPTDPGNRGLCLTSA